MKANLPPKQKHIQPFAVIDVSKKAIVPIATSESKLGLSFVLRKYDYRTTDAVGLRWLIKLPVFQNDSF